MKFLQLIFRDSNSSVGMMRSSVYRFARVATRECFEIEVDISEFLQSWVNGKKYGIMVICQRLSFGAKQVAQDGYFFNLGCFRETDGGTTLCSYEETVEG